MEEVCYLASLLRPVNQCGYFSDNKSKSMYQNKYMNEWISVCCSECM